MVHGRWRAITPADLKKIHEREVVGMKKKSEGNELLLHILYERCALAVVAPLVGCIDDYSSFLMCGWALGGE